MKPTYEEVIERLSAEIDCMEQSVYTFSYKEMVEKLLRALQDMMPEFNTTKGTVADCHIASHNKEIMYNHFKSMGRNNETKRST